MPRFPVMGDTHSGSIRSQWGMSVEGDVRAFAPANASLHGGLMKTLTVLVVLSIVAGACSGGRSAARSSGPVTDSVTVVVVNNNFYDANVYAAYEGLNRRRLGLVVGNNTETFRIAWHQSDLRMVMSLVGAGSATSNSLVVSPGDVVRLELLPDLHLRANVGRAR